MRTLVYKRTHTGDPDAHGCFGIWDCMGRVRNYEFDSVIGVGGVGSEPRSHGIEGKINWIGIGARKKSVGNRRAPVITFEHFVLFERKGDDVREIAPALAEHLLSKNARVLVNFTPKEQEEIEEILRMAENAPPSASLGRLPDISKHDGGCGCGTRRTQTGRNPHAMLCPPSC